ISQPVRWFSETKRLYVHLSSGATKQPAAISAALCRAASAKGQVTDMVVSREDVLNALNRVVDPASGKRLVEGGMVEGLVLKGGHVSFAIEVPAERGAAADPLRREAEDRKSVGEGKSVD